VYIEIAVTAILSTRALTIDHIADQIGEHVLYARPRGTELVQLGVVTYGKKRASPTTGRQAGTIDPSAALVEFLANNEPNDEQELERLIRSFVQTRVDRARAEVAMRRTGRRA
jgi:hypothetical protein